MSQFAVMVAIRRRQKKIPVPQAGAGVSNRTKNGGPQHRARLAQTQEGFPDAPDLTIRRLIVRCDACL